MARKVLINTPCYKSSLLAPYEFNLSVTVDWGILKTSKLCTQRSLLQHFKTVNNKNGLCHAYKGSPNYQYYPLFKSYFSKRFYKLNPLALNCFITGAFFFFWKPIVLSFFQTPPPPPPHSDFGLNSHFKLRFTEWPCDEFKAKSQPTRLLYRTILIVPKAKTKY